MNYFNFLRKIFIFYLISGIVLGLAVFLFITVYRYNSYLADAIQIEKNISINKKKIKNQTHKIEAALKYLMDDLNLNTNNTYYEGLIFQTLDNIKTKMPDASITVTTFGETGGEKILPVEIKTSVATYKKIIDYVEYIESFRIPRFKIDHTSISKGQKGGIMLDIEGVIVAPSLKMNIPETETMSIDTIDG